MFTGLIEHVGIITEVLPVEGGRRLTIEAPPIASTLAVGDSIAADGVCTTVESHTPARFTVALSPETLRRTTLGTYAVGHLVNLERPLLPTDRLGGHIVSGHVDGLATLTHCQPDGISRVLAFRLNNHELAPLLVEKGSIAIQGISLTVNQVGTNDFTVAIIPHTWQATNLSQLTVGQAVNVETDLLGKYVQRLLQWLPTNTTPATALNPASAIFPAMPTEGSLLP
ncbi:MAG: riboflavin synthase [Candidatus Melainabacteria bacterium]|nr:riboflavin synthase [Candidatus Melainabacteria bacterium]